MFYLLLFFLLLLFAIPDLSVGRRNKLKAQLFLASVVVLTFVAGLRWETGVDWLVYTEMFGYAPTLGTPNFFSQFPSLDVGYWLLMSIIKTLGGGIQLVFLTIAIASFTFLCKALKTYTPYKNISLLLYFCMVFFVLDMSGIRQALALNIFFYSIQYIKSRNFKKYLLFTLLAFSFHWSSLIFLPIYFILNRRLSTRTGVIFFMVCVFIAIFQVQWFGYLLGTISNIVGDELYLRIQFYTQDSVFAAQRTIGLGAIALICIFLPLCLYREKLEKQYPYFNIYFNLFLLQALVVFALFEFVEISGRLVFYFSLSTIIVLPYLIHLLKGIASKTIFFFLVVFYGFFVARIYLLSDERAIAYTPYQNYIIHRVILNRESDGAERVRKHEENFMRTMQQ